MATVGSNLQQRRLSPRSTPKAGAGATASAMSTSEEVQNRFLKLLVTQLKNQDPLNPLDNAAVTTPDLADQYRDRNRETEHDARDPARTYNDARRCRPRG
jgi:hypothetical protein